MATFNPLEPGAWLRTQWGIFQDAAQNRLSTSSVWEAIRQAAEDTATRVLEVTSPGGYSAEQLEQAAQARMNGVTIQDVNYYRAAAGRWLAAKDSLEQVDRTQQLTAKQIFSSPWYGGRTNPAIPERFIVRGQFQARELSTGRFSEMRYWTFTTEAPFTTLDDLLNAFVGNFSARYPELGVVTSSLSNLTIERI